MHNAQKCPKMSMLGNLWTLTCFKKKKIFPTQVRKNLYVLLSEKGKTYKNTT